MSVPVVKVNTNVDLAEGLDGDLLKLLGEIRPGWKKDDILIKV